ncbi:MAG: TraM recognition domain-containing protein [Planctomycetes bacterium]|nr:TraM recognition domain-containing protein [Planctomycetota bacterium]
MRNAIDLLSIATGRIGVPELYRLVISAPTSLDQLRSEEWKAKSYCYQCLAAADRAYKNPVQRSDFEIVADYFCVEFPNLSEKTRSVVVSTCTSMVDVLNRGILRQHFCSDTNLTPEATEQGKIILIDFPVKQFGEVGVFAQVLWKYAFQRTIERRNVVENPRPVFLWADEAQNFITSYDMQFQTTCRSSRVATVLLTQNVSNVYAALGGSEKGRVEAASLFANLNTKILHANSDPVTNEWAASIVGRTLQQFANGNTSSSNDDSSAAAFGIDWLGHTKNTSAGFSESFEWDLQPSEFLKLRTGGPANDWLVDAVVVRNGKAFAATGRNWLVTSFEQARRQKRRKR